MQYMISLLNVVMVKWTVMGLLCKRCIYIHVCVCLSACISIYNIYLFVSDVFKTDQLLIS